MAPELIIMDACEEYARRGTKKEELEVETLSEWIKSISDILKRKQFDGFSTQSTPDTSLFFTLMLSDNIPVSVSIYHSPRRTFVCKRHYISILVEEPEHNGLLGTLHTTHIFFCIGSA